MVEIIRTAREDVKYDENGHRISNCKIPNTISYHQYFCDDIRLEEMKLKTNTNNNDSAKTILLFHGGGYIGKLNTIYTKLMYKLCEKIPNYKIIAVEYKTLKEFPFPYAFEDAIKVWDYLIEKEYNPQNIIIMGDSAGGGLGLALTMYLRDNNVFPKAYMGLSPWVNLDDSSECFTNQEKKLKDPLFGTNNVISILGKMYADKYDIKDWRISPLYGNYEKLPNMYITYGELEILRDDIIEMYNKAKKETNVELKIYKKCQHDVITSNTKEAKIAINDIATYITKLN